MRAVYSMNQAEHVLPLLQVYTNDNDGNFQALECFKQSLKPHLPTPIELII